MKETVRKNTVDLPFGLHDARVNKIRIEEDTIIMEFSEGFFKPENHDCVPVEGKAAISIAGADLDFCRVYLIESDGRYGKFKGEKLSLEVFVNRFPALDFEIIDETYGYNQSKFSGYFYKDEEIKECEIEIYHFGDMKYIEE